MEWNNVAVTIIPRDASFVTKGSMNVSEKRKALSTISTPGAFSIVCSDDRISDYSKLFF
jgi:peroxiredoxin